MNVSVLGMVSVGLALLVLAPAAAYSYVKYYEWRHDHKTWRSGFLYDVLLKDYKIETAFKIGLTIGMSGFMFLWVAGLASSYRDTLFVIGEVTAFIVFLTWAAYKVYHMNTPFNVRHIMQ